MSPPPPRLNIKRPESGCFPKPDEDDSNHTHSPGAGLTGVQLLSTLLDKVRQLVFLRGNRDGLSGTKKQGFYFTMMGENSLSWGQRLLVQAIFFFGRDRQLHKIMYYILCIMIYIIIDFDNNSVLYWISNIYLETKGPYKENYAFYIMGIQSTYENIWRDPSPKISINMDVKIQSNNICG